MKKSLLLLAVSGGLLADDYSLNNHWFITGDFLYLQRVGLSGHTLVLDNNKTLSLCKASYGCSLSYETLSTRNLVKHFNFEPGYRAGISYMPNKRWTVELLHFWVNDWSASAERGGEGALTFPFNDSSYTFDFFEADSAEAHYSSHLNSTELNAWLHITPRRVNYFSFSWLFGGRYIYLKEKFRIAFTKEGETSSYRINTWNQLGIAQGGASLQMNPTRHLSWELITKVGIFGDCGVSRVFLGDYGNTVTLRNFRKSQLDQTPGFLTEAYLSLTYQLFSHLNIHAAYQFLYLNGVLLAPEQIDKRSPPDNHRYLPIGAPLYHGFSTGLTLAF